MTKSRTCRTCLESPEVMVNSFDVPQNLGYNIILPYNNMLSQCIQYPFYKGDFLPETICLPRLKDAKSAFKIITKCRRSHQFLKESEIKGWSDERKRLIHTST